MLVTELNSNEVIHVRTEQEAIAICQLMHDAGLNGVITSHTWILMNGIINMEKYVTTHRRGGIVDFSGIHQKNHLQYTLHHYFLNHNMRYSK